MSMYALCCSCYIQLRILFCLPQLKSFPTKSKSIQPMGFGHQTINSFSPTLNQILELSNNIYISFPKLNGPILRAQMLDNNNPRLLEWKKHAVCNRIVGLSLCDWFGMLTYYEAVCTLNVTCLIECQLFSFFFFYLQFDRMPIPVAWH